MTFLYFAFYNLTLLVLEKLKSLIFEIQIIPKRSRTERCYKDNVYIHRFPGIAIRSWLVLVPTQREG